MALEEMMVRQTAITTKLEENGSRVSDQIYDLQDRTRAMHIQQLHSEKEMQEARRSMNVVFIGRKGTHGDGFFLESFQKTKAAKGGKGQGKGQEKGKLEKGFMDELWKLSSSALSKSSGNKKESRNVLNKGWEDNGMEDPDKLCQAISTIRECKKGGSRGEFVVVFRNNIAGTTLRQWMIDHLGPIMLPTPGTRCPTPAQKD